MTARSALCVLIGYGADLLPHSDEGKDSFTRRVLGREEEDSSNMVAYVIILKIIHNSLSYMTFIFSF